MSAPAFATATPSTRSALSLRRRGTRTSRTSRQLLQCRQAHAGPHQRAAWQTSFDVAAGSSPFATHACVDTWLTDFRRDVPKIDVPVLVVHGTEDRILPYESTAARLPALLDTSSSSRSREGPHNIAWTHPAEVDKALLEFVGAPVAA
jgi:pimeloyl-ACP methyl ester carboxylesterase